MAAPDARSSTAALPDITGQSGDIASAQVPTDDVAEKQKRRRNRLSNLRRRRNNLVQKLDGYYEDFHDEFDVAIYLVMRCSRRYLVYDTSDDAGWREAERLDRVYPLPVIVNPGKKRLSK
ncbi:hypothetical protein CCHR01_17343 [Colletotrichum chrysophilum]|uniref:Uncharacterized protein n=1 Tax=Colletotrichum chrysophilum TaxID=1836956 RepID=A0AAD9A2G5_9PEZI|nr:hypothetical protein CCHR01_17343 [Colletotrichum chrysophilum]